MSIKLLEFGNLLNLDNNRIAKVEKDHKHHKKDPTQTSYTQMEQQQCITNNRIAA